MEYTNNFFKKPISTPLAIIITIVVVGLVTIIAIFYYIIMPQWQTSSVSQSQLQQIQQLRLNRMHNRSQGSSAAQ